MDKLPLFLIGIMAILTISGCLSSNDKDYLFEENEYYVGMLSTGGYCMIPEGCGAPHKLFSNDMKNYTQLLGDFKEEHSGLVIKLVGNKTTIPLTQGMRVIEEESVEAIEVEYYKPISKIPYHEFLVKKAGEYTDDKYPCLISIPFEGYSGPIGTKWNKEFFWEVLEDDTVILKVRMTNTFSSESLKPYYELWYDGNSGLFIKELRSDQPENFC